MEKMTCSKAKKLDMVDYFKSIGHQPQKIASNDYWYCSPFRKEQTPSFKINRKLNLWYDHGIGEGGNLIDFGIRYHQCSVSDLLKILDGEARNFAFSFHQPSTHDPQSGGTTTTLPAGEKKKENESSIVILEVRPLKNQTLIAYLQSRRIPSDIAQQYCSEIDFSLYGKIHTVVGFKNDLGGYELRSENFKGASSPKGITHIRNQPLSKSISVLEGFTDFLSLLTLQKGKVPLTDFLILNSLSFVNKSLQILQTYPQISLFLDRNLAGRKTTASMMEKLPQAQDGSKFYRSCEDLNEYLKQTSIQKKSEQDTNRPKIPRRRKP